MRGWLELASRKQWRLRLDKDRRLDMGQEVNLLVKPGAARAFTLESAVPSRQVADPDAARP